MYVGLAGTASFFKSKHEFRILPKNPEFSEGTNGQAVEIAGDFPFMLRPVEAFIAFSADSVEEV
jgi:hypothetical protein